MISRVVLGVALTLVMLLVGPVTYVYLSTKTSKVVAPPAKPTAATPRAQAISLPGTIYVAQDGALYSLSAGRFHQLTPEQGWMMPSLTPDGSSIIAVKRSAFYSDVYVLNTFGTVMRKITSNAAPPRLAYDTGQNHWSFYPRVSADGRTLWMAYDKPKYGYDVVMSIWSMPFTGTVAQGKIWTNAADYTGGDVQPIPVSGGVIYTKYDYGPDLKLVGRLWYTNRAYSAGKPLTDPAEDCRNPALSPDGKQVAMVCTYEKQVSYLTLATWNGSTLGPRRTLISNQMVAQPVWAPDSSGIAYLAPGVGAGPFQLWFLPRGAYAPLPTPPPTPTPGGPHNGALPTPSAPPAVVVKPLQITTNNGFDATSPLAWR
jgi:Tol biopolymer transport system component